MILIHTAQMLLRKPFYYKKNIKETLEICKNPYNFKVYVRFEQYSENIFQLKTFSKLYSFFTSYCYTFDFSEKLSVI